MVIERVTSVNKLDSKLSFKVQILLGVYTLSTFSLFFLRKNFFNYLYKMKKITNIQQNRFQAVFFVQQNKEKRCDL